MTRIRNNKFTESNEYFQQFMTRVRDNRVREGKGSNKYFQQFMTRIRDNKVRRVKVYSSKDEQQFKFC